MNISPRPSVYQVATNLIIIIAIIGIAYYVGAQIGVDKLREQAEHTGLLAPLLLIFFKALAIVAAPLSGVPVYAVSGALYGFWKGLGLMLIGDALGATIAFYISRSFGVNIVQYFISKQNMPLLEKMRTRMGETRTFIRTRIFFAGFPEAFAYASGLTTVRFSLFLPVYMAIQAFVGVILVGFGEILVSGNPLWILAISAVAIPAAIVGVWWFHLDLKRNL